MQEESKNINIKFNKNTKLNLWAAYLCLLVSGVLLGIKVFVFKLTNSLSFSASLLDSGFDFLLAGINILAMQQSLKLSSKNHRFGLGKVESLASFTQGILMLCFSFFTVFSGLFKQKVTALCGCCSTSLTHTNLGMVLIIFSIIINLTLIVFQRYVLKNSTNASLIIETEFLHYLGDFFINISLLCSLFCLRYGYLLWLDKCVAVGIAAFVMFRSARLIKSSWEVLTDKEIPQHIKDFIVQVISKSHGSVHSFSDLRTRRSGSKLFVQCKLKCSCNLTVLEFNLIQQNIVHSLQQKLPNLELFLLVGE